MKGAVFVCVICVAIITSKSYSSESFTEKFYYYSMDTVNFEHSMKDIPVPNQKVYFSMMISSLEKFIQSLRWRVIFFLNPFTATTKETYGFKTLRIPEPVEQLKEFEKDLFDMIKNIEFRDTKSKFQRKLSEEKNFIRVQDKLIVAADKTPNYYLFDTDKYHENVEKKRSERFQES